jgi:hypothetical protein
MKMMRNFARYLFVAFYTVGAAVIFIAYALGVVLFVAGLVLAIASPCLLAFWMLLQIL